MNEKIFVLSHGLSNGGSQRVASLVANTMRKRGYDVFFVAASSPLKTYELNENIKYVFIGKRTKWRLTNYLARCLRLQKLLFQEKPKVVISFVYEEGLALLPFLKIEKIYTMRNAPEYFSKVQMLIMKFLYRRANSVVFQTEDAKNYFDKKTQNHSVVIENPISENLPDWDVNQHDNIIMTACRLSPQKNLKMLCDAFAMFSQEFPEYTLRIFGKGPLEEEIKHYAQSKGIASKVEFPGFINNVHEEMKNASIFALSSNYEGISNSMIEALGIGVPTVCTDCPIGGARMIIENGKNGILVPMNNANAMADSFKIIAMDTDFAKEISIEAKKLKHSLSLTKIGDKWEKLLWARLLNNKKNS